MAITSISIVVPYRSQKEGGLVRSRRTLGERMECGSVDFMSQVQVDF